MVSKDAGNRAGRTVIVAPISSTSRSYPEHVEIGVGVVEGFALCGDLHTVNRSQLRDFQGQIDSPTQSRIDTALRSALALG